MKTKVILASEHSQVIKKQIFFIALTIFNKH